VTGACHNNKPAYDNQGRSCKLSELAERGELSSAQLFQKAQRRFFKMGSAQNKLRTKNSKIDSRILKINRNYNFGYFMPLLYLL
jgi:hypothetical protein